MNYAESLRWLRTLPDFERTGEFTPRVDVSLMRDLLRELGDPQAARATMHIAGSKGKGSTGAIAESILRSAGLRTGFYISPHLHRHNERIRIDGEPIPQDEFGAVMATVRAAMTRVIERAPGRAFVAFDALTAAAFASFRDRAVEVQIVEVGLGGRLDPTNVLDNTDVVVLTPISLEHTAVLGDTIPAIAREKAAIIKEGSTVVVAPQRESALDVFREVASSVGATVVEVAEVCRLTRTATTSEHQEFRLKTPSAEYSARLPLLGRHQLDNAAAAVVACEEIMRRMSRELAVSAVREGIAAVRWPGRFEVIRRRPLTIVDGAHNGDSMKRVVTALREHFGVERATIIFATLDGKDVGAMADALAPVADAVLIPEWRSARAADAATVAREFRERGLPVSVYGSLAGACDAADSMVQGVPIVACGAISFAAAVREYLLGLESDMIIEASAPSTTPGDAGNEA